MLRGLKQIEYNLKNYFKFKNIEIYFCPNEDCDLEIMWFSAQTTCEEGLVFLRID